MRFALYLGGLLLFLLLVGCTLLTEALRASGVIPVDSGMMAAAKAVDSAIGGWASWLLFGSGVATSELPRAAVKLHRARKARKLAARSHP